MPVFLTKNVMKRHDFVNGMPGVVEHYNPTSRCLTIRTKTDKRVTVFPYTEDLEVDGKKSRVVNYPIRAGYSSTVYKLMGANLEHVTLYLDRAWSPAAAYVALSRVAYDNQYLIGGDVVQEHFVPAR